MMSYKFSMMGVGVFLAGMSAQAGTPALEKAKLLVGDYKGEGQSYVALPDGLTKGGATWTDELAASNPRLENGRAIVDVAEAMHFSFPRPMNYALRMIEGYYVNADGSAGAHFYQQPDGSMSVEVEVGPNHWEIRSKVRPDDFANLGMTEANAIRAEKIMTKLLTCSTTEELQSLTELTYLKWTAADGTIQSREFVDMQAKHRRPVTPDSCK